jgi:hypothetical protein
MSNYGSQRFALFKIAPGDFVEPGLFNREFKPHYTDQ